MTERRMPTDPQLLVCEELEANLKNDATGVEWEYGALVYLTGKVGFIADRPEDVRLGRSKRYEDDEWTPDVLVRRVKSGEWAVCDEE